MSSLQPQTDGRFVPIQNRGSIEFNENARSHNSLTASASGMLRSKDDVLMQCRDAIAQLHADLDKERDNREAAISEKNRLSYDLSGLESSLAREKSRRQDAESNWKKMKREVAEMQCQLDDAESEGRTHASQAQSSRQLLANKTADCEDLRDQVSKLQLENQDLMGRVDVSLLAQRKIQEELDQVKNKHGTLQGDHETSHIVHSRERDELEAKHRDLLRDRDRSSAALLRQIEDHKKHSANLEKTLKTIQSQMSDSTRSNIDREAELHAEYKLQLEELTTALEGHKKEIKQQRMQRKETTNQFQDHKKTHTELKSEWEQYKQDCAALRAELDLTKGLHSNANSELDKWRAEHDALKENHGRLFDEHTTLKAHHAVVSRHHDEAVASLKEMQQKHDLLEMPAKKHDEMHQIYLQSERDLADLRARYEDAEVFKQKYTDLEHQHSGLSFKFEAQNKAYTEKEEMWKRLHDERQKLHDEQITSHRAAVDEKHGEWQSALSIKGDLEAKLARLEAELDTTISRLSKTTDQCHREREENQQMKKTIDQLAEVSGAHDELKANHSGVTQEAMGLRNALDEKQLEAEHLTLELRRAKEKSMLKNTENMNRLRDKYQSRIEHLQKRVAQKEAEELKLRAIIETELTVHRRAGIAGPRSASKGVWDSRLEDKFLDNVGDRLEKKIMNSISQSQERTRKSRSRARDSSGRDYISIAGLPYDFAVARSD